MSDVHIAGRPVAPAGPATADHWWAPGLTSAERQGTSADGRPDWARFTDAVLRHGHTAAQSAADPGGDGEPAWSAGFGRILARYLDESDQRFGPAVAAVTDLADAPRVRAEFRRTLSARLVRVAARALVLELNILRSRGLLAGATGEQRYADFVRQLREPARLADLVTRYPVLARLLAQLCEQAVAATADLLGRFAADRVTIVDTLFAGRDPGRLVALGTGAGDRHQEGRSVALLRFDSGARLVYKPRPVTAHRHFNDLLRWYNGHDPEAALRPVALLDRPGYGWVEYVAARPCPDRASVERFYRRQGRLLALLYALDGADVHYENLIACADQPTLVDVETLFHPYLPVVEESAPDPAAEALAGSVYRSALLPQLLLGDDGVLDVSGLGGGDRDRHLPVPVVDWEAPATDEMRLVRRPAASAVAANRPRLDGADIDPADFVASLLAGFRTGYDLLARRRAELLRPDGPLRRFAHDEVRVVARATRTYLTLLDESTHPDVLRDAVDRDRLLDVLRAGSAGDPVRMPLVRHELVELWRGDVPIFRLRPGGRDLWSGTGDRIPDVLDRPPLDRVLDKVRRMDAVDRRDQEWVIQATLATRRPHRGHETGVPERRPPVGRTPDPDRLLATARAVADQIVARGFADRHRTNWLGLELLDERFWTVMPLGAGLTSGYTGVALFLAQLAAVGGDSRYADVARRALRPLPRLVDRLGADAELAAAVGCGGFAGFGGIGYALAQVSLLLDDPELAEMVPAVVRLADATVDTGDDLGLHDGTAGCLAAMLAVHAMTGLPAAWEAASRAAQRLLDRRADAGRLAPGFAFGRAGVGWALLRFAARAGDQRAGRAGRRLMRECLAADLDPYSWCSGLPGVLLAALDAGPDGPDGVPVERALTVATAGGPLPNHSLCHGELGRLELVGAAVPVAARHRGTQIGRAGLLLSAMELAGPRCGTPDAVPSPGLLNGLAGVGHGLLRLARPDRIPAALLLQPAYPHPRTPPGRRTTTSEDV